MDEKIFLSVVIPTYNEEKRLPKTLKEIHQYLSTKNYSWEIIIVNSASRDKTKEIVEEFQKELKNVVLINLEKNLGKGFAVRFGCQKAKGEIVIFTDADNSTPIYQIEKFIPEIEKGSDIVIASRDLKGAILDPPQPPFRRLTGFGFRIYRKLILDLWEIADTQCGFKMFKKEVIEKVFPICKINGFAFDPEILILAKKKGYKIKEVPVYWKNDLESKVKIKNIFEMAFDLLKIRINLILNKYNL
jgi:dolichyl-phosphate beta-glucosyltransferase